MIHAQFVINLDSFLYPGEQPEARVQDIQADLQRFLRKEFVKVRVAAGPHEIIEED